MRFALRPSSGQAYWHTTPYARLRTPKHKTIYKLIRWGACLTPPCHAVGCAMRTMVHKMHPTLAGCRGCPAASYLLLRRQKKVTEEKATPVYRRFAVPSIVANKRGCATRPRCARDSNSARLTPPLVCAYLRRRTGEWGGTQGAPHDKSTEQAKANSCNISSDGSIGNRSSENTVRL